MSRAMAALASLALCLGGAAASGAAAPVELDIVILVDTSESMQGFGKQALAGFADGLGGSSRMALATFGEEARMVRPLRTVTGKDRARLMKSISTLSFSSSFKDMEGGLTLALSHLVLHARPGAVRAVVLVTNGDVLPSAGPGTAEDIVKQLTDGILYEYLVEEIPVHTVAFGASDVDLMQDIGSSTGGKSLVAPDAIALNDALSLLSATLAPAAPEQPAPVLAAVARDRPAESDARMASTLVAAAGGAAALALVMGMLVLALLLVNTVRLGALVRSQPPAEPKGASAPGAFAGLRKKAGRITKLLMEARSSIEGFNVDLEDYAAESWEKEKELSNRYHSLASSLFLLIDNLEVQERSGGAGDGSDWLARRARKMLAREGIEEITVSEGDSFDGMYHKHAGDRDDDRPEGAVLEVTRKGYYVMGVSPDGDDIILRHAEVVVSRGNARRRAG
ncbi:MAG: nucleotide exchange factor GrpE [Deltaproteobacteria bacterium]|nr:nucleotide exchange factor GrpE [Deltaproteobacteria bacterium]